jgi:Carboxypeptidase regulatory-like domain
MIRLGANPMRRIRAYTGVFEAVAIRASPVASVRSTPSEIAMAASVTGAPVLSRTLTAAEQLKLGWASTVPADSSSAPAIAAVWRAGLSINVPTIETLMRTVKGTTGTTMHRSTARVRIWRVGRIGAAVVVSIAGVRVLHAQNPLPAATARSQADSVATLTGVVQDEEGLGVAGALVMADSGRRRATSDEYGHFRLEGIPAGKARVEVRSYGHAPLGFDCEIGSGLTVELVLTVLPVPPSPNVVVEQIDSLPIPGAVGHDAFDDRRRHTERDVD